MEQNFVNIYIQKILNEVSELTKTKLLLQTQLEFEQAQSAEKSKIIADLELDIVKLSKSKKKKVTDLNNEESNSF